MVSFPHQPSVFPNCEIIDADKQKKIFSVLVYSFSQNFKNEISTKSSQEENIFLLLLCMIDFILPKFWFEWKKIDLSTALIADWNIKFVGFKFL